jgi:hypothetical protein
VIEGAAHAAPFDATTNFVRLIGDTIDDGKRWEAERDAHVRS